MVFSSRRKQMARLAAIVLLAAQATAQNLAYSLLEDFPPATFFDHFTFNRGADATQGTVTYVDRATAGADQLYQIYDDHVTWGVDHTSVLTEGQPGRKSIRLVSNNSYTHGMYILDISHMPFGCGTWPAFWSLGPNWPHNGEIDILEGVNRNVANTITLHSAGSKCTISGTGSADDSQFNSGVCTFGDDVNNGGCSYSDMDPRSYGAGFNANGGGVYVMEWTTNWIRIWFFPRGTTPDSITQGKPDPATFGTPSANFQFLEAPDSSNCTIDQLFSQHQIVFDVTFCGQWAGQAYGFTDGCPVEPGESSTSHWGSCNDFIMGNPQNFTDAYWSVNSLKVYQQLMAGSASTQTITQSLTSATPAISTDPGITSSLAPALGNGTSTTSSESPTGTAIPLNPSIGCPYYNDSTFNYGDKNWLLICDMDTAGDSTTHPVDSFGDCVALCVVNNTCMAAAYAPNPSGTSFCYLKSSEGKIFANKGTWNARLYNGTIDPTYTPLSASVSSSTSKSTSSSMSSPTNVVMTTTTAKSTSMSTSSTTTSKSDSASTSSTMIMSSSTSSSTTSLITTSSSTTTAPLATSTGDPKCDTLFVADGSTYHIYCNATIAGSKLIETTTPNFANCIDLCSSYNGTCIGSVFYNATAGQPQVCVLKSNATASATNQKRQTQNSPVNYQGNVFAAYYLPNPNVYAGPPAPTSYSGAPDASVGYTPAPTSASTSSGSGSSSITTSTVTSVSISTNTHTVTVTPGVSDPPGASSIPGCTPSLCQTCGLTPTVLTCPGGPTSTPSSYDTGTSPTSPPNGLVTGAPGTCPVPRTVHVTAFVTQTITSCAASSACPATSMGGSGNGGGASGGGGNTGLNGSGGSGTGTGTGIGTGGSGSGSGGAGTGGSGGGGSGTGGSGTGGSGSGTGNSGTGGTGTGGTGTGGSGTGGTGTGGTGTGGTGTGGTGTGGTGTGGSGTGGTGLTPGGSGSGGSSGPLPISNNIACPVPPQTQFLDIYGMVYNITCGIMYTGDVLQNSTATSFANCMTSCDTYNYGTGGSTVCIAVSYDADASVATGLNCVLYRSVTGSMRTDSWGSALLQTRIAGGGPVDGGSGGTGGTGTGGSGGTGSGGTGTGSTGTGGTGGTGASGTGGTGTGGSGPGDYGGGTGSVGSGGSGTGTAGEGPGGPGGTAGSGGSGGTGYGGGMTAPASTVTAAGSPTGYLISTATDSNGNTATITYSTLYSGGSGGPGSYGGSGTGGSGGPGATVTQGGGGSGGSGGNGNYGLPPICSGSPSNNTYYTSYLLSGTSTIGYITYPATPTQTAFYYRSTTALYYDTYSQPVTGNDGYPIATTLTATIPIGYGTAPIYDINGQPLTTSGTPAVTTYYATWAGTAYSGAPANYGLSPSTASFPASGPGGTAAATSFAVATDVVGSSTLVETKGYVTAPEGYFYTGYPCYGAAGRVESTLVATTYPTTYTTTGVSTITSRETTTDGAGHTTTVTQVVTTSYTATVVSQVTAYSTVVSTYYSVSVVDVTKTVTASSSSSSKTSTCRTAATHYAVHKRGILGGVLEEVLAGKGRGEWEVGRIRNGMAYATQEARALKVKGYGPAGMVVLEGGFVVA